MQQSVSFGRSPEAPSLLSPQLIRETFSALPLAGHWIDVGTWRLARGSSLRDTEDELLERRTLSACATERSFRAPWLGGHAHAEHSRRRRRTSGWRLTYASVGGYAASLLRRQLIRETLARRGNRRRTMRAPSLTLVVFVLAAIACKSSDEPQGAPAKDPREALLVGTWVPESGTSREYNLNANGSFSMHIDPSKCGDGSTSGTKTTMSGKWKLDGEILHLDVEQSSSEVFRGSTMRDSIVSVDKGKLVLGSSVVVCGDGVGEQIQLRQR